MSADRKVYVLHTTDLEQSTNPIIQDLKDSAFYILPKSSILPEDIYRNSISIDVNGTAIDQSIYFDEKNQLDEKTYDTKEAKHNRLLKKFTEFAKEEEKLKAFTSAYNQDLMSRFSMAAKRSIENLKEGKQVTINSSDHNTKFYLKNSTLIASTPTFSFTASKQESLPIQANVEMVYELVKVDPEAYKKIKQRRLETIIKDYETQKKDSLNQTKSAQDRFDRLIKSSKETCAKECQPENIPRSLFKLVEVRTNSPISRQLLMSDNKPPKKKLSWGFIIAGCLAVVAGAITMGFFGVGTPLFFMGLAILCGGVTSAAIGGAISRIQSNRRTQLLSQLSTLPRDVSQVEPVPATSPGPVASSTEVSAHSVSAVAVSAAAESPVAQTADSARRFDVLQVRAAPASPSSQGLFAHTPSIVSDESSGVSRHHSHSSDPTRNSPC